MNKTNNQLILVVGTSSNKLEKECIKAALGLTDDVQFIGRYAPRTENVPRGVISLCVVEPTVANCVISIEKALAPKGQKVKAFVILGHTLLDGGTEIQERNLQTLLTAVKGTATLVIGLYCPEADTPLDKRSLPRYYADNADTIIVADNKGVRTVKQRRNHDCSNSTTISSDSDSN